MRTRQPIALSRATRAAAVVGRPLRGRQACPRFESCGVHLGATWEAASGPAGAWYTGKSPIVTITLGGGPTPTPNMVGLAPNVIPVPEPSSIMLGLLGLGAIALIRRRM